MFSRLTQYWVYGGFLAGIVILVLLPQLSQTWSTALVAVFLQLPMYMLHQYEEHDNDRFRQFFNRTVGRGKEVLSPEAVFVINVPGVWGTIAVSFYLAAYVSIGYGLIAAYLTLVNGVVHVVTGMASRSYNPGLATAVAMFLPAGGLAIVELQATGEVGWHYHLLGLLTAIGIHAAIIGYVKSVQRSGAGGSPSQL
ncbi:MAG TPA: HXXEE domain-containing protein, partial [Pirellulales bacterium]|nr:HXXEE domain-containing protein [Pirellulales bacterium]